MSSTFLDRVKVNTATTGTGTVTGGAAVSPYRTAAAAGAVTGITLSLLIEDGAAWEISTSTYNSTGPTFTRTLVSSSTGSLLNLSGSATVAVIASAADLTAFRSTFTTTAAGLVPASVTNGGTKFLADDGTFKTVAAGGGGGSSQHEYECFGSLATAASFTGVNTSVTSLADGAVSLFVSWASTGPNTLEVWKKSAPATPYDLYARFMAHLNGGNDQFGICVRNSSNGKIVAFGSNYAGNPQISCQNWTNATTFSSAVFTSFSVPFWFPNWFRIKNDGTNLTFYYSMDGNEWTQAGTASLASFIGTADEIGIHIVPQHVAMAWVGNFGTTTPT